jgi:hypothetical protein
LLKAQDSDGPGLEIMDEILARILCWRAEAQDDSSEHPPDPHH